MYGQAASFEEEDMASSSLYAAGTEEAPKQTPARPLVTRAAAAGAGASKGEAALEKFVAGNSAWYHERKDMEGEK